jgi:formylglycine-generating enzyme required for sulfatase activity
MGNRPSGFGRPVDGKNLFRNPPAQKWQNLPVENVSWLGVCGKEKMNEGFLGKVNRVGSSDDRFHLPTEAQWEYACRAGTTTSLNNGRNITTASGKCHELDVVAWYGKNSGGKTHPVGGKKANAWGLHDMHGNVSEWCADWYGEYPDGTARDPVGGILGAVRVLRGGSWRYYAADCHVASRSGGYPGSTINYVGFRLARSSSS